MFIGEMLPTSEHNKTGLFKFLTRNNSELKNGSKKVDDDVVSVTEHSDDESFSFADDEQQDNGTPTLVVSNDASDCATTSSSSEGSYSVLTAESLKQQEQQQQQQEAAAPRPVRADKQKRMERRKKFVKRHFQPASLVVSKPTAGATPCPMNNLSTEDRQAFWLIWSTLQIHSQEVQRLDERAAIGKRMLRKLFKWDCKRMQQCLQCPPEGRGGVLADMARHILAYKMGNLCSDILQKMVQYDVLEIAKVLVDGMKAFLTSAIPDTSMEHIRATSPRDWSLLARAWTESMEECYQELWTPRISEAWARVMTLLLRSIFKVLWYKEADDLNEKLERKVCDSSKPKKFPKMNRGAASCRNLTTSQGTKAKESTKRMTKKPESCRNLTMKESNLKIIEWGNESCPNLTGTQPKKTKKKADGTNKMKKAKSNRTVTAMKV